jgi:hypothetical protein
MWRFKFFVLFPRLVRLHVAHTVHALPHHFSALILSMVLHCVCYR